jgi:hypothetical protein
MFGQLYHNDVNSLANQGPIVEYAEKGDSRIFLRAHAGFAGAEAKRAQTP